MLRYLAGLLLAFFSWCPAWAQGTYPSKPITFVVCCNGLPEAVSRALADEIGKFSGQSIIVQSKPGVNGSLAAAYVARSVPDGYTVLIGTSSTHAANQSLYKKLPYDFVHDFVPISGISKGYLGLIVRQDLPVSNLSEFIALAKRSPGQLTFGYASSSVRAGAELLAQMTGVKFRGISYKTNPQAAIDLSGGRIDFMTSELLTATSVVASGKARILAVSSPKRISTMPNVPTVEEAGVPGYELSFWLGAWVPAKTSSAIVKRLNGLFVQALASPKVQKFLETGAGSEAFPTTSDELMKFQLAEKDKWHRILSAAGIQPQ
ncbi:Bug family tripartite tricarboxylate transporter substrate binding protein [Candidimonas nitroreducens]|nr:tripartite tricarboxylate transporter substrate binding protein [Candidimonas nitroreducens]